MENYQNHRLLKHLRRLAFCTGAIFSIPIGFNSFSIAGPANNPEIPEERQIQNAFTNNDDKGTILEATNPMELLNRLRQATALDDATSPSDAVDDALKALEIEEL